MLTPAGAWICQILPDTAQRFSNALITPRRIHLWMQSLQKAIKDVVATVPPTHG
jgi:hypothetical protein